MFELCVRTDTREFARNVNGPLGYCYVLSTLRADTVSVVIDLIEKQRRRSHYALHCSIPHTQIKHVSISVKFFSRTELCVLLRNVVCPPERAYRIRLCVNGPLLLT